MYQMIINNSERENIRKYGLAGRVNFTPLVHSVPPIPLGPLGQQVHLLRLDEPWHEHLSGKLCLRQ